MPTQSDQVQTLIGVISDTHGLLRPEAIDALSGVDLILHAGDVGSPDVLESLKLISPVVVVRGNNDKGQWADALPIWDVIEIDKFFFYMIHDLKEMDLNPAAAGFRVVVSGHSHKASVEDRKGVLYINPGSAGPRRFKLPVTVARIRLIGESVKVDIVELEPNLKNHSTV